MSSLQSETHARKWTAFYLSLAVPGAGQAWVKSFSCFAWWLAMGLLASGWNWLAAAVHPGGWLTVAQTASFFALGLASAEHAKRLAETDRRSLAARGNRSRVRMGKSAGRRIEVRIEVDLAESPVEVWRRVADLPRFLTIDTFHDRVTLMRPEPAAGVDLVLSHNAFGRRFLRFGRILQWREGQGYSFSDLSRHGTARGFPHVFFIDVAPLPHDGKEATRLFVTVRGKWNNRWIPPALGRLWVYYVTSDHARLLRKGM